MVALGERAEDDWRPPVVMTVASTGEGIAEVVGEIDRHWAWLAASGERVRRRRRRARAEIETIAVTALRVRWGRLHGHGDLEKLADAVASGGTDSYTAADQLLAGQMGD